jgi:nucleotide-binding universal stress UspA family protein
MFKKILVPTDGSSLSDKAIEFAIDFAKQHEGKIVAVSVAEPFPQYAVVPEAAYVPDTELYEKQAREFAQQYVQKVADAAAAANVPCETWVALSFSPYEEIIRAAEKFQCDAIFMASHGRKGLNRLFLGSQTQKVLASSSIPVMVFR